MEKFTVLVPNVFTPNQDGTNDLFYIHTEGVKEMRAEIYDRWGLKMHEWNGLTGSWNGETLGGMPAPDGTYYYIINLTDLVDKKHLVKGAFTLIR